jgi:hypothetical protein
MHLAGERQKNKGYAYSVAFARVSPSHFRSCGEPNRTRRFFMGSAASPSIQKRYKNRHDDAVPVNINLTREAASLLLQYTETHPRGRGQFLSRLIVEHDRRKGFREFLSEDMSKEIQKLCRQVRKDMRREGDV